MSRILVADDNSNIQKMVALALKEEGIDVVAVGNGEAAMRKIPDLRPDLVLADIFMPVRNGYEVCEFVKSDSRYMATPVVLLVGAFDPLDEQETQRVRADGVLKKPFVPPDPLINMVKALLAKSNGLKPVPAAAATPAKPAPPPQMMPAPSSQPSSSRTVDAAPGQESLHYQAETSPSVQQKPPAFIAPPQHSEPQTANAEDSDEVVTAARDPNLGDPFWATPEEAQEPEETEEKPETEPEDIVDLHSFSKDESSAEGYETPFRPDSTLDRANSGADLGETIVLQEEAASPQETNRSQPTAASEYGSNAVVGQPGSEAPSSSSAPPETPTEIFKFDPTLTFPAVTQEVPIEEGAGEADRAAFPEPRSLESPVNNEQIEPREMEWPPLSNHHAVITAATEAARLAFSELNTLPGLSASAKSSERKATVTEQKESLSASAPANPPPSPTPEMIEAVVARLLERMQPEIMEVVNREVLRPAIEAIVRREMKKS